jgi:mono/diheme cytochrome c family protein
MKNILCFVLLLCIMILIAGCGGSPAGTAIPTATTIPTYEFVVPTDAPAVATAAAATAAAQNTGGLDPQAVERGRGRYEALQCAECHGENGEGNDQGPSLITSTMEEDAFISLMRSGGEMGPEHQFSTNVLSESGGRNLYQYLLSIRQSE